MYVVYVLDSRIWVNYKGETQILHCGFWAKANTKKFYRGTVPTYPQLMKPLKVAFEVVCPHIPGSFHQTKVVFFVNLDGLRILSTKIWCNNFVINFGNSSFSLSLSLSLSRPFYIQVEDNIEDD